MGIDIEIDDALMVEALRTSGLRTASEAVELGLKTLFRLAEQGRIRRFPGKINWEGDLDSMRLDTP